MRTVVISFDEVMCQFSPERSGANELKDGQLVQDADIGLSRLMATNVVAIETSRNPRDVRDWLEKRLPQFTFRVLRIGAPLKRGIVSVTDRVVPDALRIDGSAYRFRNWQLTMHEVLKTDSVLLR